jgi:hypothetical protein
MASYLTGLVLRKNGEDFIGNAGVYKSGGSILSQGIGVIVSDIPVPGSSNTNASIDGDYWAVPINDGVVAGFKFLPYNAAVGGVNNPIPVSATNPIGATAQSFAVFKLSLNYPGGYDYMVVLGTVAQYNAAAAGGAALPLIPVPNQAGCQTLCNQNNTTGLYFGNLGIPNSLIGQNLYPYGYFNGVALPAAAVAGYASPAALLTFLNTSVTGWAAVGTWTLSADNRTAIVTESAGPGTDVLCAQIVIVNQSA